MDLTTFASASAAIDHGSRLADRAVRSDGNPRQPGRPDLDRTGQAGEHNERHTGVVRERAPHVVVGNGGQRADQGLVDRRIPGEVCPGTGDGA